MKPFGLAEIFCGGFVGRAHAVRIPDPILAPIHTAAANDLGLGVASAYSHTRGATLYNQCAPQGPTTLAGMEPPFGWHADICTSNWHADFGMISVNTGSKAGLHRRGDETLMQAIALVHICQPPLITFEQEAGFKDHHQFQVGNELWNNAGSRNVTGHSI